MIFPVSGAPPSASVIYSPTASISPASVTSNLTLARLPSAYGVSCSFFTDVILPSASYSAWKAAILSAFLPARYISAVSDTLRSSGYAHHTPDSVSYGDV